MTIKEFDALNVLIEHAQRDISYGEDGSYRNEEGDDMDREAAAQSREAIKYIMRLLMKKQSQMAAKKINRAFASGKISIEV